MKSGKLRESIAIQAAAHTADESAGQNDAWSTIATVFAEVLPTGGSKALEGGMVVMGVQSWRVRLRYREGLGVTHRFVWKGQPMAIMSIADPTGQRSELLAFCQTGVPT